MAFWKRRRAADEDETYEEPVESTTVGSGLAGRESRKLSKLRKKAQKAAQKAARESERARQAARKVREASTSSEQEARSHVAEERTPMPTETAGQERSRVLAKKDERRLKKLRRKAHRRS